MILCAIMIEAIAEGANIALQASGKELDPEVLSDGMRGAAVLTGVVLISAGSYLIIFGERFEKDSRLKYPLQGTGAGLIGIGLVLIADTTNIPPFE